MSIAMNKRKGFTLVELLVVIAIIALLMAILMPALNRVREQGKRIVCENNLKNMVLCWILYSDDYDGRIMNGDAGTNHGPTGREIAWVQKVWSDSYATGGILPESQQIAGIKGGSMWLYAKDIKLYRCPTGRAGEKVTYSVIDSMNAYPQPGNTHDRGPVDNEINKLRSQIKSPVYRIVFFDEGYMTPDSYAVHSNDGSWWDDPTLRHGNGTCFGMADGRAQYIKWSGANTVKAKKNFDYKYVGGIRPPPGSKNDWMDLLFVQKSCWWKLHYTPPFSPPF